MYLQGFCILKNNPKTHKGMGEPKDFSGVLRVFDMNEGGDVLVMAKSKEGGDVMATFDAEDVRLSCRIKKTALGFYCPHHFNFMQEMAWGMEAMQKCKNDVHLWNSAFLAVHLQGVKMPGMNYFDNPTKAAATNEKG